MCFCVCVSRAQGGWSQQTHPARAVMEILKSGAQMSMKAVDIGAVSGCWLCFFHVSHARTTTQHHNSTTAQQLTNATAVLTNAAAQQTHTHAHTRHFVHILSKARHRCILYVWVETTDFSALMRLESTRAEVPPSSRPAVTRSVARSSRGTKSPKARSGAASWSTLARNFSTSWRGSRTWKRCVVSRSQLRSEGHI